MTPGWKEEIAGYIFRFFASPRSPSEGPSIATARVARRLFEKLQLGEIADIAEEWEEEQRQRMKTKTASDEADVELKRAQILKTKAEAYKTAVEGMRIANQIAADSAKQTPAAPAAARDEFDRALSQLRQAGGSFLVRAPQLKQIIASTTPALIEIGVEGASEASSGVTGHVDTPIPLSIQAEATQGEPITTAIHEAREPGFASDARVVKDAESVLAGGDATLNASVLNSFALNEGPATTPQPAALADDADYVVQELLRPREPEPPRRAPPFGQEDQLPGQEPPGPPNA